ncbi:MAG: Biopolymer transport protein, partial [Myxococcaceae bacterium]|nr:Biopolymer transport protein [Myxococcaceae bacterium]
GISAGGGHGGKKSVDHSIPLVPFIDLLLCCVMFLLVTAVWNQLARLNANQQQPGQPQMDTPPPEEPQIKLILQVQNAGYTIATTAGDQTSIPKNGDAYDVEELVKKLKERRELEPNRKDITVSPEDGVKYSDVIKAMDTVVGEGYAAMSLSDSAGL